MHSGTILKIMGRGFDLGFQKIKKNLFFILIIFKKISLGDLVLNPLLHYLPPVCIIFADVISDQITLSKVSFMFVFTITKVLKIVI